MVNLNPSDTIRGPPRFLMDPFMGENGATNDQIVYVWEATHPETVVVTHLVVGCVCLKIFQTSQFPFQL